MTSIALGVFIIFIIYVMIWSIKNDDAGSINDQTGFIRMRAPTGADRKSADRPNRRRGQTAVPRRSEQPSRRHQS